MNRTHVVRHVRVIGGLCMAVALGIAPAALAEDSQGETPKDEQDAKLNEPDTPQAVKDYLAYVESLDKRYPDTSKVDGDRFMAEEGETAALLYCRAIGFDGPCAPGTGGNGRSGYVGLDARAVSQRVGRLAWYDWLFDGLFNIGVIPDKASCPSPYPLVQLYHDDEDRRNANGRSGWIGATVSNSNTTWRFCKLDFSASMAFRPLPPWSNQYDYAVQQFGLFCPPGSRRVIRRHDNEDSGNANNASGPVFPSFNQWPGNWWMFTCHFDAGPIAMGGFPNLGFSYGVFAPTNLPAPYALQNGYVRQDDEDFLNTNLWLGSPDWVMGDGSNTWRGLARVRW